MLVSITADISQLVSGTDIAKLLISVLLGSILGLEREIRGKSAGFRTLALICFGATIYTMCSYLLGVEANRDRIAANIITGIGFIGAGVIFRNNSSVSGITTAASIWVTAAMGMLVGIGKYSLAGISLLLSLFILYALDFVQWWIDDQFEHRDYTVIFRNENFTHEVAGQLRRLKLKSNATKTLRSDQQIRFEARVTGRESKLNQFNDWLLKQDFVQSIDW